MKNHIKAKFINSLKDIAISHKDSQSLREALKTVVIDYMGLDWWITDSNNLSDRIRTIAELWPDYNWIATDKDESRLIWLYTNEPIIENERWEIGFTNLNLEKHESLPYIKYTKKPWNESKIDLRRYRSK